MPKISVVLVNYNHSRYLDERIQSLLNQTYRDFELIIIDNGSTDNSVEVIRKYAVSSSIKTRFYEKNVSPYQRWNEGVDLAEGEYLQIVSADDSCHPMLLEKLVEYLEKYPAINLVYSHSLDIDDDGNELPLSGKRLVHEVDRTRWSKSFLDSGRNECRYMLFEFVIVNAGAVLMRRKAFIEAGGFDVRLRLSADHMLFSKILFKSDFVFVAEPLNYLRRHPNTITSSTKDDIHLEEKFQVINYLLEKGVQPPDCFWSMIYEPAVVWWIRLMTQSGFSFEKVRRYLRVYVILKKLNPNVNHLVIKELSSIFRRKMKLI